jgi:hypothetical protein
MKMITIIIGCLILLYISYLVLFFVWGLHNTKGIAYFGKPLSERRKLKRKVQRYRKGLIPLFNFIGPKIADLNRTGYYCEHVFMPWSFCPKKSVSKAIQYKPQSEDIFIATQIRSGTTWMQQLVYEVLSKGKGDLSDQGHIHIQAVSPWIEAMFNVAIDKAPLIGEKKRKIVKTHLPSSLCPYSEEAQYIYVARHPVSCCASSIDWLHNLAGPFIPSVEKAIDFFCSDKMYFSSWPKHVEGYWQWFQSRSNVLFLHFEELKQDLPKIISQVADFLVCELTATEISTIAEKCSFSYMREHAEWFEMSPPTPFMPDRQGFFKSGSLQRQESFDSNERAKIINFCREQLTGSSYPISRFYRDFNAAVESSC